MVGKRLPQSSMVRTISRNTASNWIGFAVQVGVVFLLTPFVLSSLGPARYGVWALVTGLTGYYGLLDLGIRVGITQYLTRYLATRNFVKMNAAASTGFVAMVCCGCLVATATVVVAFMTPVFFRIPPDVVVETQLCILVIGLSTAVSFAFQLFSGVFTATQRFGIFNAIFVSTTLMSAVAIYVALGLSYGLVTLSLITAITNLAQFCVMWRLAYRVLPELVVSPRLAKREEFWPIISFGAWNIIIRSSMILKTRADIVLVGFLLPIQAIAPYALAVSMAEYFDRIFKPIGFAFFPALTVLDARGDVSRLRIVYLAGTKFLLLLAIAIGGLSAAWSTDFFSLWIRTDVTENGTYPSPAILYCILVLAAAGTASQHIGQMVCMGTRKMKSLAAILTCETVVKIGLSVLLINRFGLIGGALATLIAAVIFQIVLIPANVLRILDIRCGEYLRITWTRPLLTTIAVACLLVPMMYVLSGAASWLQLFVFSAITSAVVCIPLLLIGLNPVERQRFVLEPVRQLQQLQWPNMLQSIHGEKLRSQTLSSKQNPNTEIDRSCTMPDASDQ